MKQYWNDDRLKKFYLRILEDAKNYRKVEPFTDEELDSPYITSKKFKTKSNRIWRMIQLAYFLGQLKGISYCDEMKTPVCLDSGSKIFDE